MNTIELVVLYKKLESKPVTVCARRNRLRQQALERMERELKTRAERALKEVVV